MKITGTWELREEQGGMMPSKTYVPGNGTYLIFTDTNYERYNNGIMIRSGKYSIVKDSTFYKEVGLVMPDGEYTNRIIFENDPASSKIFFQISGEELTFLSGYFPVDAGSRMMYVKTKNTKE
jgi:hypothetical protein